MTTEVKVEAQKVDLFEKFKILKWLVKLRSFQFLAILPTWCCSTSSSWLAYLARPSATPT
jgi:hypothetical protein